MRTNLLIVLVLAAVWVFMSTSSRTIGKDKILYFPTTTVDSAGTSTIVIGTDVFGQTGKFHYDADTQDGTDTTFVTIQGRNGDLLPWENLRIDTIAGDASTYFSYDPELKYLRWSITCQDLTTFNTGVGFENR